MKIYKNKIFYNKLPKRIDYIKNILYNKKDNYGIKWLLMLVTINKS